MHFWPVLCWESQHVVLGYKMHICKVTAILICTFWFGSLCSIIRIWILTKLRGIKILILINFKYRNCTKVHPRWFQTLKIVETEIVLPSQISKNLNFHSFEFVKNQTWAIFGPLMCSNFEFCSTLNGIYIGCD